MSEGVSCVVITVDWSQQTWMSRCALVCLPWSRFTFNTIVTSVIRLCAWIESFIWLCDHLHIILSEDDTNCFMGLFILYYMWIKEWLMKANGVYFFLELCSYKTREHNLFWQISTIQCCPNQDQGRTCFHQIYMTSFQEFWKCNIFRCSNMSAGDDDSQSESVYTIKTSNTLSRQGSEGHEWITSHPFNDNQAYVKVSYFWWCGGGI